MAVKRLVNWFAKVNSRDHARYKTTPPIVEQKLPSSRPFLAAANRPLSVPVFLNFFFFFPRDDP